MKSITVKLCLAIIAMLTGCQNQADTSQTAPIHAAATFTLPYLESGQVSTKAKPVKRVQPMYPKDLRRNGVQGYAVVEFIVNTEGVPQQVQCVDASALAFAEATVKAVSQWRYKPATKDGQAVAVRTQQRMDFSIGE